MDLRLPMNYELLGGAAKCDALNRADIRPPRRTGLRNLADRKNVLRAFAGSIRPAASGMKSYLGARRVPRREPLPLSTDSTDLLRGLSLPGKTGGVYFLRLMKDSIPPHRPTNPARPDSISAAMGLKIPSICHPRSRTSCSRPTSYSYTDLSTWVANSDCRRSIPFTPLFRRRLP